MNFERWKAIVMTIQEILSSTADILTPADIAEVLGCDPDTLRVIARQDPSALAPLAPIRTGSRIKFPRLRFLSWYFGETYRGDTRLNAFYLAKNSQSVGDRP